MWQPFRMEDTSVAECVHDELRSSREALVWKLDGLSEHDVRRPLTATGTNLLGLVKHVATWEARYLGEVFHRPFPEPLPRWQDADGSDLWVTEGESRAQVVDFYRRAQEHADETIRALPLDAPGHVAWWPRPQVTVLSILVHVLTDTTRHAGHADILREQLDGRAGIVAGRWQPIETAARAAHRARIETAAGVAFPGRT